MKDGTKPIVKTINIVTNKVTEATISNATLYLTSRNNILLQTMEEAFTENMELMESV